MLHQPTDMVMKQIAKDHEARKQQAMQERKQPSQAEPKADKPAQGLVKSIKLLFKPSYQS